MDTLNDCYILAYYHSMKYFNFVTVNHRLLFITEHLKKWTSVPSWKTWIHPNRKSLVVSIFNKNFSSTRRHSLSIKIFKFYHACCAIGCLMITSSLWSKITRLDNKSIVCSWFGVPTKDTRFWWKNKNIFIRNSVPIFENVVGNGIFFATIFHKVIYSCLVER